MGYVYFVSFDCSKNGIIEKGNMEVKVKNKIRSILDVRNIEEKIKNEASKTWVAISNWIELDFYSEDAEKKHEIN